MLLTGVISASSFGWPLVFYLYGGASLVWSVLCLIFIYNSPAVHPSITEPERYFIEHSLGHSEGKTVRFLRIFSILSICTAFLQRHRIPWKSLSTSLPLWAILISHCGQNWGFWTLMTEIPNYMGHVMSFNIKSVRQALLQVNWLSPNKD